MRFHPCLVTGLGGALLLAGCSGEPTYILATITRGEVPATTPIGGLEIIVELGEREDTTPMIGAGAGGQLTLPATLSLELGAVDDTAVISANAYGDAQALVSAGSTELVVARGETTPVVIELGRHVRLTPDVDASTDQSAIGIEPRIFVFGTHTIGTVHEHRFVVGNSGTGSSQPLAVTRDGQGDDQFALARDTCTGVVLGPSETCEVDVSFQPDAVGSTSANILIDPYRDRASAGVAGAGVLFSLAPPSVGFGTVALGTSLTGDVTITNESASDSMQALGLEIDGVGDFTIDPSSTCSEGQLLGPGGSCTVVVRFTPATVGARSATLNVIDRATLPLALSGNGG
jgi:hypothetical protein